MFVNSRWPRSSSWSLRLIEQKSLEKNYRYHRNTFHKYLRSWYTVSEKAVFDFLGKWKISTNFWLTNLNQLEHWCFNKIVCANDVWFNIDDVFVFSISAFLRSPKEVFASELDRWFIMKAKEWVRMLEIIQVESVKRIRFSIWMSLRTQVRLSFSFSWSWSWILPQITTYWSALLFPELFLFFVVFPVSK
jgi:hypothetical protein